MKRLIKRVPISIGICAIAFYAGQAVAVPTGADLLSACKQASQNGFQGGVGQLCEWYVTPCDCDNTDEKIPHVCLPETITTEALAREVIAGVQAAPELQRRDAQAAAALILSRIYPCGQ